MKDVQSTDELNVAQSESFAQKKTDSEKFGKSGSNQGVLLDTVHHDASPLFECKKKKKKKVGFDAQFNRGLDVYSSCRFCMRLLLNVEARGGKNELCVF